MRSPAVPLATTPASALPGLLLAGAITLAAFLSQRLPGVSLVSPMISAIVIGAAVANTTTIPTICGPGLAVAMRPVLRAAIVLLGLRVTLGDLAGLGWTSLLAVVGTLGATYVFTVRMGRLFGLRRETAALIAAGTSVCGASAVMAMNSAVDGSKEDVAHAIATVTIFGTLSMLLFPVLGPLLHLAPRSFGLWSGLSIHEIAQVIGAGFQGGVEAGEAATVSKLARVALLAPLVLAVGHRRAHAADAARRPPFPWFVLGFLAMVIAGSVIRLPAEVLAATTTVTTILFTLALAAMGAAIDLRKLLAEGWRPLALGATAWLFVSGVALLWVEVLAWSRP